MKFSKFLIAMVLMLVALLGVVNTTQAQSVSDNVSVMAGTTNEAGANTFTGLVEVQKTLGTPRLLLDNTIYLYNGESTVLSNTALLRGYVTRQVFVAGGVSFGREIRTNADLFLNPTVQVGATLDATDKLQFEPYAQLDTRDLLSTDPGRALSGGVVVSYMVNDKFGFTGDVGMTQVRNDNGFFQSGGTNSRYATGGLFFNF